MAGQVWAVSVCAWGGQGLKSGKRSDAGGIMKTLRGWITALAAVGLCGCFQVQDDLTLQADGSGKVKLTVHSSVAEDVITVLGASSGFGGDSAPMYPPLNEAGRGISFPPRTLR